MTTWTVSAFLILFLVLFTLIKTNRKNDKHKLVSKLMLDLQRLIELVQLHRFVRVSDLCTDTLRTTKTVAQARGLGSGICAKGGRQGAASILLNYLKVSLTSTTKQLFSELECIENDDVKTKFEAFSASLKRNVDKFVDVLDKELLTKKKLTIKTQEYFELATKPIDDLVSLFIFMVDYSAKQNERCY